VLGKALATGLEVSTLIYTGERTTVTREYELKMSIGPCGGGAVIRSSYSIPAYHCPRKHGLLAPG
jgi:hypothetical protein